MVRRLARLAVIVATCLSIGAHRAALQSVAWATMLVEYSQHAPLKTAIAQTFDGHHPCDLCKRVVAAQEMPKKSDAPRVKITPDLICALRSIVLLPRCTNAEFSDLIVVPSEQDFSPPTPPPRSARTS